jgi:hypothetical protein
VTAAAATGKRVRKALHSDLANEAAFGHCCRGRRESNERKVRMTNAEDPDDAIDGLVRPFEWTSSYHQGKDGLELVVEGIATAPTTEWTAELVRAEPQGINPRALLLRLTVHRPPDDVVVIEVLTELSVSYSEPVESEDQYDEVNIRGTTIKV